ncbi:MAG: YsnF/AvaK domain-containing protein [Ktedonobacteraceae bacterium]|nr:YsnF/AvaK domain-containing protein [Ktedonobacteraceae bacterium]
MTTAPLSVIIGVFRDHRLAEQALDALKQTGWGIDDPQIIEKNAHGIFGAFKNVKTAPEAGSDELAQIDLPEEQRQLYQHELAYGSSLVLVHPQSHLLEIRDILNRHGAYRVFIPFQVGGEQIISLRQEVPQIQKQIVDIGEIRIHKRVITEEKTFTIPVTREEVTIERFPRSNASQPSSQGKTASDAMALENTRTQTTSSALSSTEEEVLKEEGIFRILVREEQVIIQKQVAIVEEIVVQKQIIQEIRHLVEPVKHEEVQIERVGNVLVHENTPQEEPSTARERA